MKVLYHLTVLPPKMPQAEALSQEISALQAHFQGDLIYLNPNQRFPLRLPRLVFGFQCLQKLRKLEAHINLHHFYNPDPFPFPVLHQLKRPVIYSVTSGVGNKPPNINYFSKLGAIIVPDERSFRRLQNWGLTNVYQVKPGINIARFSYAPQPLKDTFNLLVASAPWTKAQFKSKGINALLKAVEQDSKLRLVFLWRGELYDEMVNKISSMNLSNRVSVLNKLVEVNQILAQVQATISLASQPGIIKAYPHALLDSLAAGKPVLVSQAISMADYVEQTGCGEVVEAVNPEAILNAVERLRQNYNACQQSALRVGQKDFSLAGMIDSYRYVYQTVAEAS